MKPVSIGTWITLGHPSIAEIFAAADFDWVCVDMEHSVIDYTEAQLLIAAIQSKGKQAYVRVGENNPRIIKRVLDAGADGIIVPMVCSASDARRAVEAVRYPPRGKRGVGLARAQGYGFSFDEYKRGKAKDIKLVVIIEHIDAIKNLREIIEVEGVDGTFIGPYDLSGSLGKPGDYNEPDVQAALADYERIALQYDKWVGFHVVPPDHRLVEEKIAKGYNFIAFCFDAAFLGNACRTELSQIARP
ncbi:MAG: aldolase/citrate lyase family protein [bacterium]|nr:aldolase/citrate lyase family protein [bacterium]